MQDDSPNDEARRKAEQHEIDAMIQRQVHGQMTI